MRRSAARPPPAGRCRWTGCGWTRRKRPGLRAIRLNALGANALGLHSVYQPPAADAAARDALKVLPNLDIVAVGTLSAADRLVLDTFAAPAGDRVWTVRADTLLAAHARGRTSEELVGFLADHIPHDLPPALTTLVADVTARVGRLRDLGVVRLVHCAEPALAVLIARDLRCSGAQAS